MAEYTHVGPGLPPLHGARANALILGSFPSPKSREQGFFYGHKQNRFWPMIAAVTGEPVPDWADIEAKKAIILKHGLAVWDTIGACDIKGASDASIRNAVPKDPRPLCYKKHHWSDCRQVSAGSPPTQIKLYFTCKGETSYEEMGLYSMRLCL